MHFSFWEKIGFAVLVTAWVVWGSAKIGDMLVQAKPLEHSVYKVAGLEKEGGGAAQAKKQPQDFATLLAKADPAKGARVFNKCKACHNIKEGAGAKVGPDLHNVVGRAVASVASFNYSDALKKVGGDWTYEKLDHWLEKPAAFAPGTKMTFAGLSKMQDRAEVIAYLRSETANPPPLPTPKPQPAAAPEKQASSDSGAAAAPAKPTTLAAALAAGDPKVGKREFNKCKACHNIAAGAGPKIGPDLHNVVGRPVASEAGFNYSSALKGVGGDWTYEKLDHWLKDPRGFANGTKMTFAGVKDLQKRADTILYLRENTENPPPLPTK